MKMICSLILFLLSEMTEAANRVTEISNSITKTTACPFGIFIGFGIFLFILVVANIWNSKKSKD